MSAKNMKHMPKF